MASLHFCNLLYGGLQRQLGQEQQAAQLYTKQETYVTPSMDNRQHMADEEMGVVNVLEVEIALT